MSRTAVRLTKLAGLFALSLSVAAPVAAAAAASNSFATQFPARMLAAHNAVRAHVGQAAAAYAQQMAFTGVFAHSNRQARRGTGENLWMGTRGAFSVETMVNNWASEGRVFQRGVFPAVSRTGNWEDVGHYTQIVWPTTTRVGCAIASTARTDYLVCRYSPAGNIDGRPVG